MQWSHRHLYDNSSVLCSTHVSSEMAAVALYSWMNRLIRKDLQSCTDAVKITCFLIYSGNTNCERARKQLSDGGDKSGSFRTRQSHHVCPPVRCMTFGDIDNLKQLLVPPSTWIWMIFNWLYTTIWFLCQIEVVVVNYQSLQIRDTQCRIFREFCTAFIDFHFIMSVTFCLLFIRV